MRARRYEPKPWNMDLDDLGDLSAPPGSVAWARAVRAEMASKGKESTLTLRSFKDYLAIMDRTKGYQQLENEFGHPFPSLMAFCVHRQPHGLGYDIDVVEAIQQETRDILLHDKVAEVKARAVALAQDPEVMAQPHGGQLPHDNEKGVYLVNSLSDEKHRGGNSALYLVKRLKRDHPDIAEALAQGHYPSARAAAKVAGFIKDPPPLTLLRRAWRKATPDERAAFLADIMEGTPCLEP